MKFNKIKILSLIPIALSTLPISLTSCSKNKPIVIKSIEGVDWDGATFGSCFDYDEFILDEEKETVTYTSSNKFASEGHLRIPDYVKHNGKKYKVILGDRCFSKNSHLYGTVELNIFTNEVPTSCFLECVGISKIIFNVYPTLIGDSAFNTCINLEGIFVKDNNKEESCWTKQLQILKPGAFKECQQLNQQLIFYDCLEEIGNDVFYDCKKITYVSFSFASKISSIPPRSFSLCSDLTDFYVGPNVKTFASECFAGCTSLKIVNLPTENMLFNIGDYAFSNCYSFQKFSKKCYFSAFSKYCFNGCQSIEISPWLDSFSTSSFPPIDLGAFQGCGYLTIKFVRNMPQPGELAFANLAFSSERPLIIDLTDFDPSNPDEVLNWTVEPTTELSHMFAGKPNSGRIRFKKTITPSVCSEWNSVFKIMGFQDSDFSKEKWWVEYV